MFRRDSDIQIEFQSLLNDDQIRALGTYFDNLIDDAAKNITVSKLEFNEGEYSIEDTKIEAKKLYKEFTEDKTILKIFDYDVNLSNDEIKDKIGSMLKYNKDKLFE